MKKKLPLFFLLFLGILTVEAQSRVSGKVTLNGDGSALPGVTVQVKGSGKGSQTNGEGNYVIEAAKGQTIVFSFIGMVTKEVLVENQSIINVVMEESLSQLNEIVVLTALGLERKKDDDVSSSTLIDASALKRSGESGVIQSLSGKTSGLTVVRNSGDPGAGAYIQIRGQNTIFGESSPLIILDGVPISNSSLGGGVDGVVQQSRLNDLNQDDIENVTVLKGAAAAAVWGTGAANGVILIQTKKGKAGGKKVSIEVSNQVSLDHIIREFEKQTKFGQGYPRYWISGASREAYTFLYDPNSSFSWGDKIGLRSGAKDDVRAGNERFESQSGNVYYPIQQKNSKTIYNESNRDQVFQTGFTWNKSVGINFNSNAGSTFFSFSDWDQEGIFRDNSTYRRTTLRINNETKLSEKAKLKFNTTFSKIHSDRIQQGSNLNGLYLGYLRTPADFDNRDYKGTYYNPSGVATLNAHRSYRKYLGDVAPEYNNPGWTIYEQENPNDVSRFILNPELSVRLYKNITLTSRFGIDYYNDVRESYFPVNSAGAASTGSFGRTEMTEMNTSFNTFLTSTHVISDKFNFSWILGSQFESLKFSSLGGGSTQFTNPYVGDLRIFGNAIAANESVGLSRQASKKSGAYAVINAEILNQVYLEMTGRYELPSTLPAAVFYPSVSAGWVFNKYLHFKPLNYAKLRASFGQVGIEPGAYLSSTNYGAYDRGSTWGDFLQASNYGNPYARSSSAGNPNLKRELVTEYEVGGDFRFFNDFITIGTTYYNRKTTDALLPVNLAPSSGYTSVWRNAAEISNKGFEIDAGIRLAKTHDLEVRLDANFSKNKNMVESLSGVESFFLDGFAGASSRVVEGYPFAALWGGKWQRDGQNNLILDQNGFPLPSTSEGVIGDPNPKWKGGLGANLSWKGISLSVQFETFQGNQVWAGTSGILKYFGIDPETANEFVTKQEMKTYDGRTVSTGTTVRGNVANFGGGNVILDADWYSDLGGGFGPVSEQFIVDGSWTKLREVSAGYTIPASLVQKIRLNSASINFTGRNLFIWSPIKYFDPEVNLTGASKGRGLEYFTNPGTGSYVVTVKLGF
ncbi:SusC/RagA family TonB-linked outer membrane protein [Emticicia sp. CRIBPO]|uniref:SusC/RagA family TonB-linked outer membrane protein n=1 Tax=Emticicia sp. CRIBPO TaxID=2683258 RepID=UPI001412A4C1|nr:SusC/RagA family TonB-linked outer membrane protein [Emticicia sp. CRIBPO]NBA84574.1 SusC/RagA family TonB-linked outer membrane protein [Emticicia sp. CRIBPO]